MVTAVSTALSAAAITPNANDCADGDPSIWTFCARENEQCNFSGTKEVRYGINDVYVSQILTNGVSCNNNTFGDPVYGLQKQCEYRDAAVSGTTWTFCAWENERCNFTGSKEVRYGINDVYVSQIFTDGISCDNNVFGDPVYGFRKQCEYRDAGNPGTLPTPAISPNGGSYSGSVSVTMQSSASGASIYFTTNGSTPTQTSTLYTGATTLTNSATVRAKAFKSGSSPSAEASALFTVVPVGTARGVTRFADGSLGVESCSNYNPSTRQCSGGSDIAYGGDLAIQHASDASAATDVIQVRSFSGVYIGTSGGSISGGGSCIVPRSGDSATSRFMIRGYQNEIPTVRCMGGFNYVHIYQMLFDPTPNTRDVICVVPEVGWRIENIEIRNCGAGGHNGGFDLEMINLNVHHTGFDSSHCELGPGQCHGAYLNGTGALIDGGEYHHNEGWGIHCYPTCANVTIRNVRAHSNGGSGIGVINGASDANVVIYNSLAYNNGVNGIAASAGGALVYNVTAVNNGTAGLVHGMLGTVRDSIISGGYTTETFHFGTGAFLGNSNASNNITSGDINALFVDARNGNFTSTVEGVGADLSSAYE
jgi:hypothetical protein